MYISSGNYWPIRPEPPIGDSTFRVLKFADMEWGARLNALPPERRDIHFDPRILAPYLKAYGWELGLAVTGDAYDLKKDFIIQPVLVTKEGQLRHGFNFGGPISNNPCNLGNIHRQQLYEWANRRDVTNEYCTLNPFLWSEQIDHLKDNTTVQYVKESVAIKLSNIKPRGTTRRLATQAKNSGVIINSHHIYQNLHHFINLYEQTMARKQAADHWKFGASWFEHFAKFIYPHLLLAHHEGKVVAACLVAYKPVYQTAYYHFAASADNRPPGVNHMMVLAAAEMVKQQGAKYLYLGGGLTDRYDDPLFVFKSGFSKMRLPIWQYARETKAT